MKLKITADHWECCHNESYLLFSFQGFVSGITGIVTKPIKGMLSLTFQWECI